MGTPRMRNMVRLIKSKNNFNCYKFLFFIESDERVDAG